VVISRPAEPWGNVRFINLDRPPGVRATLARREQWEVKPEWRRNYTGGVGPRLRKLTAALGSLEQDPLRRFRLGDRICHVRGEYKTPKMKVATVTKSIAAIASRWLLSNAFSNEAGAPRGTPASSGNATISRGASVVPQNTLRPADRYRAAALCEPPGHCLRLHLPSPSHRKRRPPKRIWFSRLPPCLAFWSKLPTTQSGR